MIRYIWNREGRYIYDESLKVKIPVDFPIKDKIYVNILEKRNELMRYGFISYKVKLYCSNGEVLEGWTSNSNMFIKIEDTKDELFDGRFNQ